MEMPGYLENCHRAGHDPVKVGPTVRVKFAPKNLHPKQGGDEDGEHEEDEEGGDAGDRVDQRLHQVAHAVPIPACHCVLNGKLNENTYICFQFTFGYFFVDNVYYGGSTKRMQRQKKQGIV